MTTAKTTEQQTELAQLATNATTSKLSPDQEKKAALLAKECLLSGKAGMAAAIEPMIALPWVVGVTAITEAWPELKPTARKQLLAMIGEQKSDHGKRFRLSLSRGLFAADAAASMKLAAEISAEMSSDEGVLLTPKDRQIFGNVFIGKAKPWLLNINLAEMKPAEANAIIRCAVAVCFPSQCPPLTQQSILAWIASAGYLEKLNTASTEAIVKAVKRWHPKMKQQLQSAIPELPAPIAEALSAAPTPHQEPPRQKQPEPQRREQQPSSRPAQPSFDLGAALRQIEALVQSLRSELNHAKSESRRREPSSPRGRSRRDESAAPFAGGNADLEELQNHNRQLTETVAELRAQLEDLASHHEDVAVSMGAHGENPNGDAKEQFKSLLGIKLQKDYADFKTLSLEPMDEVFREPYRLLLEDVFETLTEHGIKFAQS